VADVDVMLEIWPHMIHAWPVWNAKLTGGPRALTKAGEFIRAHDRRLWALGLKGRRCRPAAAMIFCGNCKVTGDDTGN
jgi:hypothetical protein